jgi:hypothetical protein
LEKQLARKGLSHRAKNHYQHRVVLIENVSWKCRQKSGAHDERQTDFASRSECIGKTQPDVSWRLCRHSWFCRMLERGDYQEWSRLARLLSGMVFLQLLLMIRSFGRPLSQLLAWDKQPCAWARELLLERGTLLCRIAKHSPGKLSASSNLDKNVSGRCCRQKHRTTPIQ